jgi:hypothetical protein
MPDDKGDGGSSWREQGRLGVATMREAGVMVRSRVFTPFKDRDLELDYWQNRVTELQAKCTELLMDNRRLKGQAQ